MNIVEIFQSLQTQEQAIDYFEEVRWHGKPVCPYCASEKVCRHASGDRTSVRWQCESCHRAFSVTVGTIFHGTHIPLRQWFLLLALMLNAKKSSSSYQIARDLGMRRPTVWSMMHRIRTAMDKDPLQGRLLYGIVQADEIYVSDKPRKGNRHDGDKPNRRGKDTTKTPAVKAVERGGNVIKGLSSLVKRGWCGQQHYCSVKYMSLCIFGVCHSYNQYKAPISFDAALGLMVRA